MDNISLVARSDQLMSYKSTGPDGTTIGVIVMADENDTVVCCHCGAPIPEPTDHRFNISPSLLVTYPDIVLAFRTCSHEHVHELGGFFDSVKIMSALYLQHLKDTLPADWETLDNG